MPPPGRELSVGCAAGERRAAGLPRHGCRTSIGAIVRPDRTPPGGPLAETSPATHFTAFGYYLPPQHRTVEELVDSKRTKSHAQRLRQLGHERIHVAGDEPVESMAQRAVEDLVARSGFDLRRVDLVLYGGGLASSGVVAVADRFDWLHAENPHPLLRFPGPKMQIGLGLGVPVLGVSQLACSTFQGAARLARGLLAAEPALRNVLLVAADKFPVEANREIVYTLVSDGACAAVVSRGEERHRLLSCNQVTRGAYWDNERSHDQLVAAYYPLARQSFDEALQQAGTTSAQLARVIPHNVNLRSWETMARVLGVPLEKVYTRNIARHGHAVSADNVVNYVDALDDGTLSPGDKVAWFVTGFGAHWSTLVMEV